VGATVYSHPGPPVVKPNPRRSAMLSDAPTAAGPGFVRADLATCSRAVGMRSLTWEAVVTITINPALLDAHLDWIGQPHSARP
jgi:hypothetical protein